MRVRFIGTGDAFGSGGRLQAAIHVEAGDVRLLLDCGDSTLIGLRRDDLDPNRIDAVFLTHFHGDHFGGLPAFLLDAQFRHRSRRLVVIGPQGTRERVLEAFEALYRGSSETALTAPYEKEFVEISESAYRIRQSVRVGDREVHVTFYPAAHLASVVPTMLRLGLGGRTIAYSGDTAWTDDLIALADGADLLICECYSYEKAIPMHMSHSALVEHAEQLRCGRIVLTHAGPEMLARAGDARFELAYDGMEVSL